MLGHNQPESEKGRFESLVMSRVHVEFAEFVWNSPNGSLSLGIGMDQSVSGSLI